MLFMRLCVFKCVCSAVVYGLMLYRCVCLYVCVCDCVRWLNVLVWIV